MKIHEFQAKAILADAGVPIPRGRVAASPAEVRAVAQELGGPVVVKAQIHAGGRGKGGGVTLAQTPDEAEQVATRILGMMLRTHQTGPEGQRVKRVLVEEAMTIRQELYLGIVIDRAVGLPVLMASAAGGMDIEEVARTRPTAIAKVHVDPATGIRGFHTRKLAFGLGLQGDRVKAAADFVTRLYAAFEHTDCSLAEINPLAVAEDGRLLALDAKMNFDDNALFRHPEVQALRDLDEESPLEVEASKYNLNYIKLDGNVGCMVNGAGLAMATMDIIKLAGGQPANFLDVGGAHQHLRRHPALRSPGGRRHQGRPQPPGHAPHRDPDGGHQRGTGPADAPRVRTEFHHRAGHAGRRSQGRPGRPRGLAGR
jgi:succinyl-CoA synthetase beta subunit